MALKMWSAGPMEEAPEAEQHWVIGTNMPGYLPEGDPWICETWTEALTAVEEILRDIWESAWDLEDQEEESERWEAIVSQRQSIPRLMAAWARGADGFSYSITGVTTDLTLYGALHSTPVSECPDGCAHQD